VTVRASRQTKSALNKGPRRYGTFGGRIDRQQEMDRMKVLQLNHFFYPGAFGGVARVAYDISKELAKRGHDVTVYTTNAFDRERNFEPKRREYMLHGFKVRYFKNILRPDKLYISPSIISALQRNVKDFDIIHLHSWRQFQDIFACFYAKKHGVPYVFQAHGGLAGISMGKGPKMLWDRLFGCKLLTRLLKGASSVIALSQTEAQQYRDRGVSEEKIVIIPNGVDLSEYKDLPSRGLFRAKYGIDDHKKVILYMGRINKTKGIDLLIKAYAHLVNYLKFNDAVLIMVGPDDGYLNETKSLAHSLGVASSTLFIGFVSDEDKLRALVDAEVFVTPSFTGFPVTFLEACAVGVPIVTTTLGETLDWIEGNTGYVIPPTPKDLAEATRKILSNDELYEAFSRNCRNIVRTKFSIDRVVSKLELLYQNITDT
jgi:glycosyltransferase involved in cell wall biosynthesis